MRSYGTSLQCGRVIVITDVLRLLKLRALVVPRLRPRFEHPLMRPPGERTLH